MDVQIIMSSDEYGAERFPYDNFEEAVAGLARLARSTFEHQAEDGVQRSFQIILSDCKECEEWGCPGVIDCPRCYEGEHGPSAAAQVADHGMCRTCQTQGPPKDCANCDEEFRAPEAEGREHCSPHCENRSRGEECEQFCRYCEDDKVE